MGTRKKARPGRLELDMKECAIIAHYTTEYLDPEGIVVDTSDGQKKVRLPKDFVSSEIPGLAQEIITKCKYIPASKLQEVRRLNKWFTLIFTAMSSANSYQSISFTFTFPSNIVQFVSLFAGPTADARNALQKQAAKF